MFAERNRIFCRGLNRTQAAFLAAVFLSKVCHATTGSVTAWGSGQSGMPGGLNSVTTISTALDHSVVLNANGTVTAWGYNFDGQTAIPGGLNNVVAISAGDFFSV